MVEDSVLDKLRTARDKIASAFKDEAADEVFDNGNLSVMTQAIQLVEQAINIIKGRT